MPTLSTPLPRALLRDEVFDILRNAIIDGTLPPGSPLIEVHIASQMGISRAPLREALRELEREGLVVSVQHKGTVVVTLTDDDIEEVFSLRAALERLAVRRAFQTGTTPLLRDALEARIVNMGAAVRSGNVLRAQDEDYRFHEQIIRASGHSRLLRSWQDMLGQIRLAFRVFHLHPGYPGFDNLVDRHRSIVDIMGGDDVDRAELVIQEHVIGPGNPLMWHIRSRASSRARPTSALTAPASPSTSNTLNHPEPSALEAG